MFRDSRTISMIHYLIKNRKLIGRFVFERILGNRKGQVVVVSVFEIRDGPIDGELQHDFK